MQSFDPESSADASGATSVIVVGVDGSQASKDALRWAARPARLTSAELRVIMAWRQPVSYGYTAEYSDVDFEAEALTLLGQIVDEVIGTGDSLPIRRETRQGHPAQVLVAESEGADLLVVGSRGHGAFAGMLLGSTSQHCVQHATVPVTVVDHGTN